jgi:hypothetical protein
MFERLRQWYYQKLADKHFYKWVRTKDESELYKYHDMIDKKFRR